jgi:glycosyltransferase involved in cell wall biosynthesis
VQFDFLTSIEGSFEEEIEKMGGHVYRIPHILKGGPIRYRHSLTFFFKEHKEHKIIHSPMDKMGGLVLYEAKKAGIPIRIAHSHSTNSEGGWLERKVKQYYGRYLRDAPTDRIACSADAGRWLFPDATDRITVLRNGIVFDDYLFSEEVREHKRDELGLSRSDKVLLHVGRFDKAKNQKFAIDVFNAICEDNKDYHFLLAGTGELFDTFKEYANTLNSHDRIEFLGLRDDIPGLMAAADALIFPSIYEGLSLVLIEAQTSGLPCVITDTLAAESIIRSELVTQLPLENFSIWANAVWKIIESYENSVRTSMVPLEYDIKNIAVELEQFYIQRGLEVSKAK